MLYYNSIIPLLKIKQSGCPIVKYDFNERKFTEVKRTKLTYPTRAYEEKLLELKKQIHNPEKIQELTKEFEKQINLVKTSKNYLSVSPQDFKHEMSLKYVDPLQNIKPVDITKLPEYSKIENYDGCVEEELDFETICQSSSEKYMNLINEAKQNKSLLNNVDFVFYKLDTVNVKKIYTILNEFLDNLIIQKIKKKKDKYTRVFYGQFCDKTTVSSILQKLETNKISFTKINPFEAHNTSQTTLKIISLNINHLKNKIEELEVFLEHHKPDILSLTGNV